jgi:hypothetical protein
MQATAQDANGVRKAEQQQEDNDENRDAQVVRVRG